MHKTRKIGRTKRRLMTGLCCLGLFASELSAVVPVWAMEPAVAEQTQDAGSDGLDDTQTSDGGNDGKQSQNPGGDEGDGNDTQNPGEEGGENGGNGGETPDGSDEGNQPQNPGGEDEGNQPQNPGGEDEGNQPQNPGGENEGNQPQNPGGEDDGNEEQTPGEGNEEEAQEPGGEEVPEDSAEKTIPREETAADLENADAAVYSDAANKISWSIDSSGCLTITGTGDYEVDGNGNPAWWERREEVLSAVVDVSGITSTSKMFYECSKMRQIDLSKLDTGKVTDMSDMFSGCEALFFSTLDVGSFDTGNVTDMSGMFSGCSGLTVLDLSSFDTGNVTDMSGMFSGCRDLNVLDLSSFDTGNVTDMSDMFSSCSLFGVSFNSFDTGNVTDMSGMFSGCDGTDLSRISGFDTGNVTDMSHMFSNSHYTKLDLSNFNTGNVTDMSYMFSYCQGGLPDLSSFDTGKVTNMSGMFSNSHYTKLDLSNFDTRNVTNMSGMFMECEILTGADVSSFDTKKVTNMSYMFMMCGRLTKLDLSNFDIGSQTDVRGMISFCDSLASVSVPKNLPENIEISLPVKSDDKWYDEEYNTYTELPTGLQESITLYKNAFVDDGSGTWKTVLQISGITIKSKIYDGEPLAYTGTAVAKDMKGNEIADVIINQRYEIIKRINQEEITEVIAETPDQAGSYRLVFTVEDERYTAERIYSFDIKKKGLAVTAPTVSIEVGEDLPSIDEMTYKAEGLLGDDTFITEPKLKYEKENISTDVSGSYQIIPYGADAGNNYSITYKNGTLLVEESVEKGTTNNITWKLNEAGVLRITGTGDYETDADGKPPWCKIGGVKSVVVNISDITSTRNMFYGLGAVSDIDLSGLDTSKVTDMSGMFRDCEFDWRFSLKSLDTSSVTDMSGMFRDSRIGYPHAYTLDLDSFDTSKVTSMKEMFRDSRVYNIRLGGLETDNVTDMSGMFYGFDTYGAGVTTDLDLSKFNTENVTDMSYMFYECRNVRNLNLQNFNTGNVKNMSYMFAYRSYLDYDNEYLAEADVSGFETKNVTDMSHMFENSKVAKVDMSNHDMSCVTDMSRMFAGTEAVEVDMSGCDARNVTNMSGMFSTCFELKNLNLSGFNAEHVTDMSGMFLGCDKLENLNLSGFSAKYVENMSEMFIGTVFVSLDLSGFDFSHVTNMDMMFCGQINEYLEEAAYANTYLQDINLGNFNISKVKSARGMFGGLSSLKSIHMDSVDAGSITDMSFMFYQCNSLESLDLSGFNFSNVTTVKDMFKGCRSLKSLDLGKFDIGKVTDTCYLFSGLYALTSLNVESWNTESVTSMAKMFNGCWSLENLDVSGLDTSHVKAMDDMFYRCSQLKSLDLSSFDTSNVTTMDNMFYGCGSLENLDVGSFDTGSVEGMRNMFYGCGSLTLLDLSSFDMGKVKKGEFDNLGMFRDCARLNMIFTPRNVRGDYYEHLPRNDGDVWYRMNKGKAKEVTVLPQGLKQSILITRGELPKVQDGIGGIIVQKGKTVYVCGETINTDDLTVAYCGADGSVEKLAKDQYTTNAEQIDVTTVGERKLVVTYVKDGKELQAKIAIRVTYGLNAENTTVTLPSEADYNYKYNGQPKMPLPAVEMTMVPGSADSVVRLTENTDYTVSYSNNVNAYGETEDGASGTAAPTVIIEGKGNYSGTVTKTFTIQKADAPAPQMKNVTAAHCTVAQQNRSVDISKNFAAYGKRTDYAVIGVEDPKGIFYHTPTTDDIWDGALHYGTNVAQEGDTASIKVRVSFANYEDAELTVKIIMSDEGVAYTVAFNGMGHCEGFTKGSIKAGSLLELTDSERMPTAEGYVFAGWYKDKGFAQNQEWNFDMDTVQSDLTLYACWLTGAAQDGNGMKLCVQEIPDLTYTGSAQKPAVTVYDSDGTTRLKAGKDYTVKYVNNINAVAVGADGKPTAAGGTARVTAFGKPDKEKITNVSGTFTKDIPYVAITGKGNYAETVCRNFLILPAQIADETSAGTTGDAVDTPLAAGFVLKYTDQLVVNQTKEQKPFGSMKYKKRMKAGTDYTVSLEADEATDEIGNAMPAEWRADGKQEGKRYILPAIPKGCSGSFILTVTGENNYTGTIRRRVYVAEKQKLMRNVSIILGRNQKTRPYTGEDVELMPGYYDTATKKNYKVTQEGMVSSAPEANANDMFLVKAGRESLVWGRDYTIDYAGTNLAVGTATMTLTGKGDYVGAKSVTFKITGTPFNAKTVEVKAYDEAHPDGWKVSMPYTGRALTQNRVTLTTRATKSDPTAKELAYGEHYAISYKNNVKKGTATVTFTAKPESGYSGSFQKKFKITAQELAEDRLSVEASAQSGGSYTAPYSKNGAKLSFTVTDGTGKALREGTDYTVKYKNNKAVTTDQTPDSKKPLMTVNGKGNYAGKVEINFKVVQASFADALDEETGTVCVSCARVQKKDDMKFTDFKFKLMEGKKTLGVGETKDYVIDETDCTPEKIKAYAEAVEAGTTLPQEPSVKVTGRGGYKEEKNIPLGQYIYAEKLTSACVYVVVSEEVGQNVYTGAQITPDVAVYYGEKTAVSAARKAGEKDEAELTSAAGAYKLKKLTADKEYTRSYGANAAAGKNKGSVTVTGAGRYGGSITVKFTIEKKIL